MELTRQHSETEIIELHGKTCQSILVTRQKNKPDHVSVFYLRVDEVWHRFCLDAGVLHWQQNSPHQLDDAPYENEEQFDLGDAWGYVGRVIEHISFRDERLIFRLVGGLGFQVFTEEFDGDTICWSLLADPD